MRESKDPSGNNSPDDLDDLDHTIKAQGAGEMSLLDGTPTLVNEGTDSSVLLEIFDPSEYAGTNRYEIIDAENPIGKGGFGTVWKVRDRKLGNILVMKRLHSAEEAGRQGIARFIQEARTIASLNHQNIITVYDVGKDNKGYYIIAEYTEGGSLKDFIDREGPIPLKEAVKITEQVGRALSYAHKKRIIHRDVKPANILLTSDGTPKLVDFGLARAGKDSDLSESGTVMGSIAYMPPEQRKDSTKIDHSAGIYALGKTLYHMLTGKIPDTIRESEISSNIRNALLKAIEDLPENRYFTVEEFIEDLKKGKGKEVTHEAIESGACHSCGRLNPPDVRYCEKCGAGLFEKCPACEREKRVGLSFCGGCGTDILQYKDIQGQIGNVKQKISEKNYPKAIKEARKILSLSPNEKLKEHVQNHLHEAENKLKEIGELEAGIDKLYRQEKYERVLPLLKKIIGLQPEEKIEDIKKKIDEVPSQIKERDLRNGFKEADELFKTGDFRQARMLYQQALKQGMRGLEPKIEASKIKEVEVLLNEAKSCINKSDFEWAIKSLRIIIHLDPEHEEAKAILVETERKIQLLSSQLAQMQQSFEAKDYKQVEELSTAILLIDPHHTEAKSMKDRIKGVRNQHF